MPRQLSRKESRELCRKKQGRFVQKAGTAFFELGLLPEFAGFFLIMIGIALDSGIVFWLVFAFLVIVLLVLTDGLKRRKVVITENGLFETRAVWRDLMGWENKRNIWFDWSEVNKMEFHSHYQLSEENNTEWEYPVLIITVKGNRYPYVCQLNTWGSGRRTMDKFRQMNYAISHYSGKPAHEINTTRHQYEVIFGTHADLGQRISEEEWETLES